jgi:hypothetical protein
MTNKTMILQIPTTSDYTIGICKIIVFLVIRVFTTSDYTIDICKVIVL